MKKENWITIPVLKHPIEAPNNWTFKKCKGQRIVWALFGNDRDGCEPYYHGKVWSFWRWWFRNRLSNFKWYVIGYANWKEGDPLASWDTSHLEYKQWITWGWFNIRFIKPKKRGFLYWRPFIEILIYKLDIHFGWRDRGQLAMAILWDKEG